MKDWSRITVSADEKIINTIKIIDANSSRFVMVQDNGKLVGTITDGDIRRGMIRGVSLDESVSKIMNTEPVKALAPVKDSEARSRMKEMSIQQLPVVDNENVIIGLYLNSELPEVELKENAVVIMAGGLGSRLGELTTNCPKPLLRINEKPILEHIVDFCKKHGLYKIHISVNYLSHQIEDYFGDGSRFGVQISYLKEKEKMGTAGALSLIGDTGNEPVIVINGDLMTEINFSRLLEFHDEKKNYATMCVRNYEFQIPYGVIRSEEGKIKSIVEKPVHSVFINAGVYVLNKSAINEIPKDYYDMTDLFKKITEGEKTGGVFPVHENWIDVGRVQDLEHARKQFDKDLK